VLTDLNDHWLISCFSKKSIMTQVRIRNPKNAVLLIEKLVKRGNSTEIDLDLKVKVLKIDDFLSLSDDGTDELMERYELMADHLEPESLMQKRLEY
jgi:hypothetical protein